MPPLAPWFLRCFPFLAWGRALDRATLRADFLAGLVGAMLVLPQGVAFATLAGLPPQYGLYAAMVPAVVGALWGSSRHLVTGPTNATSLVVFATLSPLAVPGSAQYVELALSLAFLAGAIRLAMGLAGLGALVNFVSHTVLVGFTAGAAMLIAGSQLPNFLGVAVPAGQGFFGGLVALAGQLHAAQPWVAVVGGATLLAGVACRAWRPRWPYMVVALLAGSLVAAVIELLPGAAPTGIRTLGALPRSLPPLSVPDLAPETLQRLLTPALAVAIIGLTEAMSIARSLALKSGQRVDVNQEIVGQGLANLAGAFFSAGPASGSFNRSAANLEAGARTPLAAVFASLFLVLLLALVAPLAAYLPVAAMAGVLLLVAWGLVDRVQIRTILTASRPEAAVMLATFAATLVLPLEFAILLGILLALVQFLHRTAKPALRVLIPDAAHPARRMSVVRPGEERECPQMKLLRVEGALYFGAVSHLEDTLHQIAEQEPARRHLLIMAKSINFVDVAGAELLAREARRRRVLGGGLYFYSMREPTARLLLSPPYLEAFGADVAFSSKREAIAGVVARLDRSTCARCRARVFEECAGFAAPPPP